MLKSLKASGSAFADPSFQLDLLEEESDRMQLPFFEDKLISQGAFPLRPVETEILQINLGKMCNQVCNHCHVDAGPDRKEIMTRETMIQCLKALESFGTTTVDLTGGAPEMNPHFRWLIGKLREQGINIIVRSNLTIILANKKYHSLPEFFAENKVEIVSSLPFYTRSRTDRQRGEGVFDLSVKALRLLNNVGYGLPGSDLQLSLVYNPAGAFLPGNQNSLEAQFRKELYENFGIQFNSLYTITNMPISRYLTYLMQSGNFEEYLERLVNAYNPAAVHNLMCRNTISVGWDGYLFDCDFNQMLDLKIEVNSSSHISDFNLNELMSRNIRVNQHCFGCTAGAGSSCGGAIT